jgi:Protein of unknown function (DUF3800)
VSKELHACDFVAGRGKISTRTVLKYERCTIFKEAMTLLSQIPEICLFNACLPKKREDWAFERLINRIDRTLKAWNSHGIIILDQTKELHYTRLIRKMSKFNLIPSQYDRWPSGEKNKNIPIERVIEDIFFKKSEHSYFIQFVDFAAYALLRREIQIPARNKYDLHLVFDILHPILFKSASRYDKQGIIRL